MRDGYTFTLLVNLLTDEDDMAKQQAATILRAVALIGRGGIIHYDKVGIRLQRPDGSEVDLVPPEFPPGVKVDDL